MHKSGVIANNWRAVEWAQANPYDHSVEVCFHHCFARHLNWNCASGRDLHTAQPLVLAIPLINFISYAFCI